MATYSITRDIVIDSNQLDEINQSQPTELYYQAIKNKTEISGKKTFSKGRFDAYF